MVNKMKKRDAKVTGSNYMEFVKIGRDEDVREFLIDIKSNRKLEEYVQKITSYLKSIDKVNRCEPYNEIKDEIFYEPSDRGFEAEIKKRMKK